MKRPVSNFWLISSGKKVSGAGNAVIPTIAKGKRPIREDVPDAKKRNLPRHIPSFTGARYR